jgi:hypothetical protein
MNVLEGFFWKFWCLICFDQRENWERVIGDFAELLKSHWNGNDWGLL